MRPPLAAVWLALAGSAIGLGAAIIGLPHGRFDPLAFAELYHGETGTTGTVHVALDCDVFTPGTQDECHYFSGGFSMSVTVGNSLGVAAKIAAFDFVVVNNRQDIFNPALGVDGNWNSNPDFNELAANGPHWMCTPPPPNPDADPSMLISASELHCSTGVPSSAISLPDQFDHVRIASVHYDSVAPVNPEVQTTFSLSEVSIYDDMWLELMSCNPIITLAGPCFGATVNWGWPPPPTFPPTPTPTATPLPDLDGDGVLNGDDNCPQHANPAQENADANLISNAPLFAQMDTTRAMSDDDGDACDPDRDNDNIDNFAEEDTCIDATGPTDPLLFDTDGDRFRDGAECALGTDAVSAASKPPLASCGEATDVDLDGLNARLEFCFYGTDPYVADTDGDGVKDGCEAASFNTDTIVNVADLGMLASEVARQAPPAKLVNLDVNKDGAHNVADLGMVAARVGKCP